MSTTCSWLGWVEVPPQCIPEDFCPSGQYHPAGSSAGTCCPNGYGWNGFQCTPPVIYACSVYCTANPEALWPAEGTGCGIFDNMPACQAALSSATPAGMFCNYPIHGCFQY